MKATVKIHNSARSSFGQWIRSLADDPNERRRLAGQYYSIAEELLIHHQGNPPAAIRLNYLPPLFVWESPTQGMFLTYTVLERGWRLLRWLGRREIEIVILSIQKHRPLPEEIETLTRTLHLRA